MSKDGAEIITTWELRNFQSIRETETLNLKPLTIFSGPNSSGKSAVIKSLLMVAQSLDFSVREDPLVLNGEYTQLGDFDHILHHGSNQSVIELHFVIKRPEREIKVKVLIKKDLISTKDSTSLTSMRVTDSRISWGDSDHRYLQLVFDPEFDPIDELQEVEKQNADETLQEQIDQGLFNYQITNSENIVSQPQYEKAVSASLSNFLPGKALIKVQPGNRKIAAQLEQVLETIYATIDDRDPASPVNWEEELSKEVLTSISAIRHNVDSTKVDPKEHAYISALLQGIGEWDSSTIENLRTKIESWLYSYQDTETGDRLMTELARQMRNLLINLPRNRPKPNEKIELEEREFPTPYSTVIQQIRQVFGDQIFYLGPLRDDPRAIYAIPPLPNQRDVGLKGEYTAAMLDVHKKLRVSYPYPPALGKKFNGRYGRRSAYLPTAVRVWLERMGLADKLKTDMTSKVGYQLEVRPKGVQKNLDLTSLGVGVSQVLPTIVTALLAPEDSVLIFEQPEVHLHPKVQSVLGDFFLGIVQCGKQCIVETHSEHLINRIRRRIAESNDERILKQLGIYFVELKNGVSQFRSVETNEYGAIVDWPTGFFDEAEEESAILLGASMEKWRESEQQDK